ncbi:MAG: hypothetical protein J5726_01045 [Treponema sp.]|nr:hypothetical protein [Treponema sp.]
MKKNNISLFALGTMVISLTIISTLIGCKFNLSDNKYLPRPDIRVNKNALCIQGSYVNSDTKYINIYRQDVTDTSFSSIERIAIIFPAGFDQKNQTYYYDDENIFKSRKYRYYVRFVEADGSKNRTEWSEVLQNDDLSLPNNGSKSFAYTIPSGSVYKYKKEAMAFELEGNDFIVPDAFTDFSKYKPALVFECEENVQAIQLRGDPTDPDTLANINLKDLIPSDFFYKEIKLLGIVGQKQQMGKANPEDEEETLQYITWTPLAAIKIKDDGVGNELTTFMLEPLHGEDGFDYSIDSDNEN